MKLLFAGDISLHNIDSINFEYSNNFKQLLETCDFVIGNLECPITDNSIKEENQAINLSAPISSSVLLEPFQIVSLANNHIRDFKEEGIKDTINALEQKGIRYFGVGKTQKEAIKALKIEKNGIKFALFGATRYANASKYNDGGTAKDSIPVLIKQIRQLKRESFFVIPYFHWGYEYVRIPSPRERKIAHRCIDAGADLVIGSHPHIYQGIEEYKGRKIVYSLGNYIFHSSVFKNLCTVDNDPRLNESFVVTVDVEKDFSYKLNIFGYTTDDTGVRLYNKNMNKIIIDEIKKVSSIFRGSKLKYVKEYYAQSNRISTQNIKVRKKFQHIDYKSIENKFRIYSTANFQDIKNRLANLIYLALKIKTE